MHSQFYITLLDQTSGLQKNTLFLPVSLASTQAMEMASVISRLDRWTE